MTIHYTITLTLDEGNADRLIEALNDAGLEKLGVTSIEKTPATPEAAAEWARRVREDTKDQTPSKG